MTTRELARPPRLSAVLARGALGSAGKRGPYDGARLPAERVVLPAARVDPGGLRAYTRVCGFPDPASEPDRTLADTADTADTTAPLPASYPHILGFPLAMRLMAGRGFPFPLLGLVHTAVELAQHRPLHVGDRPELTVYAEGLAAHRRGSRFEVVTEARLAGALVWHSRSTYLYRHRHGSDSAAAVPDGGNRGERTGRDSADPPLPARAEWQLPSGLGRRYAAASGDPNPVHLHPLTAKLFGFPRHIAHGMWTFARCLAQAESENAAEAGAGDGRGAEPLTAHAEFKAPVLLPSTVTYGSAASAGEDGGGRGGPGADHGKGFGEGFGDGAGERPDLRAAEPPRTTRVFELRRGTSSASDVPSPGASGRLHLTGAVSSGHPSSDSPGQASRSS